MAGAVRQPQGPVRINRANPLSSGLMAAVSGGSGFVNLVTGTPLSYIGVGLKATSRGIAFDTTQNRASNVQIDLPFPSSGALTMFALANRTVSVTAGGGSDTIASLFSNKVSGDSTFYEFNLGNGFGALADNDKPRYSGDNGAIIYADGVALSGNNPAATALTSNQWYGVAAASTGSQASSSGGQITYLLTTQTSQPFNGYVALFLFWNRTLTPLEIATVAQNPWQLFLVPPRLFYPAAVSVQLLRPASTISAGAWTPVNAASLFAAVNEVVADDTQYDTTPSASTMELKLGAGAGPGVTTGHKIRYRIKGTGVITVNLRQGLSTTVASWAHSPAPVAYTTYEQVLTSGQAAAITDYTDLRLQFIAS